MFPYSPLRFDQWHALYHQPPRLIDPQLLPELSLSLSYVVKNIPLWYCKLSPGIQMNKNWNKGFFIDDCFLNYHCYNEPKSFRIHCKRHKRRKKNSSTYTTKSTYIYYCEHEIFSLSDTLYM